MSKQQLNTPELQLIEYLWRLDKAFMKEIVEQYPEPKPAYTTISTLLSRMVNKGYIGFTKLGRDKQYFPILKKSQYFSGQISSMISNFFNDSTVQFASFFTRNTDLSKEQLLELRNMIDDQLENKEND